MIVSPEGLDISKEVDKAFRETGFPIESNRIISIVRTNTGVDIPSCDIRKHIREPWYTLTDSGWVRNNGW